MLYKSKLSAMEIFSYLKNREQLDPTLDYVVYLDYS